MSAPGCFARLHVGLLPQRLHGGERDKRETGGIGSAQTLREGCASRGIHRDELGELLAQDQGGLVGEQALELPGCNERINRIEADRMHHHQHLARGQLRAGDVAEFKVERRAVGANAIRLHGVSPSSDLEVAQRTPLRL